MYNQRESQYRPGTSRQDYERQRNLGGRERGFEQQSGRGAGAGVFDTEDEEFGMERDEYRNQGGDQRRYGSGRSQENYTSRMNTGGTSNWDDSNWGDRGYGSTMGRGGYQSNERGNYDQQGNPQQGNQQGWGWNLGGYASPRGSSGFGAQENPGQQRSGWNQGYQGGRQQSGMQQGNLQGRSQGLHVGRGPKGYRRSDERITEDVNEALSQHPDLDASEIEVKVSNGEVTLTGTVNERHEKRMAEDVVEQCSGVKDVRNEIRVQQHSSMGHGSMETQGSPQHQGINAGSTIGTSGTKITPEKK